MNEITRSERMASERLSSLESPTRRLLMKGMAGLGATLTYERDGRPWRDACVFLALRGYRCSDSSAGGSWQSGTSRPGWVGTFYSIERCRSISPSCLPAVHNQRGAADWCHIHPLDSGQYQDREGCDRSPARRKHSSRSGGGNFCLRFALASSCKEMELRSSWTFLSCSERCH